MYLGLNAFRAFAFFAVFLFHVFKLRAGYLGVPAFFVLSGFLLTPILVDMKASFNTRDFFARFYGRRALRIFPLYYVYLGVVALICLIALQWAPFNHFAQFARFQEQLPMASLFLIDFAQAAESYTKTRLLTHFWSLAVEEQFYMVWPLLIFMVPRLRLKGLLLGLILLGPPIRWFIASSYVADAIPGISQNISLLVYTLPFSHVDAFAIGGYFALYRKSGSGWSVWAFLIGAYVVGVATAWITTGTFVSSDLGYSPFMADSGKHIWGYSLMNLTFANAIIHIRDRKFLPWVFENKILDYLGRISYGLYVYHFGCILAVNMALPEGSEPLRIGLALIATIVISAASYRWIESWFLQFKDRLFPRTDKTDKDDQDTIKEPTLSLEPETAES